MKYIKIQFEFSEITTLHSNELELFLNSMHKSPEDIRVLYTYYQIVWPSYGNYYENYIGYDIYETAYSNI